MNIYAAFPLAILAALLFTQTVRADSVLEYLVNETGTPAGKTQPVLIKDGKILVKGAGGDEKVDVLYTREQEKLVIIDHHKQTFMPVDEQQINRIARQTEEIQPLLQGFGEQLSKLSPQQRAKWGQMLGGNIPLDKIVSAGEPIKPTNIVKTGIAKNVAGFACERMNVVQGKSTMGEFCLADPAMLSLSSDDYTTIRSLFSFSEKLAAKTQGLASQFGIKIPAITLNGLAGVPIEMKDLSSDHQGSLSLSRILTSSVAEDLMQIPNGYRAQKFSLWK